MSNSVAEKCVFCTLNYQVNSEMFIARTLKHTDNLALMVFEFSVLKRNACNISELLIAYSYIFVETRDVYCNLLFFLSLPS